MRTLTFIAIAAMSIWFSGDVNAQETTGRSINQQESAQRANGQSEEDGSQEKSRRGKRGKRGQGMQGGKGKRRGQGNGQGRRGGTQMAEFLFTRFDKDKNGSISIEEAPDRMKQRFKNLDSDGDNMVSKKELLTAFENMGQGGKGQAGKGGKGKGGAGKKGKGGGAGKGKGAGKGAGKAGKNGQAMDPVKLVERMDKNNDGVISKDEAPERMRKRFDKIDADSSGTISSDELKSAFEKMKNMGGQVGRNKSADPNATKPVHPKRPPMAKEGA